MQLQELERHRRTVATASGEVSCIDAGAGRTALFIHGVGTNAFLWRNAIADLMAERRCIALDLPLHGKTPARPGQDFSLPGLARVVEDFCEAMELKDVDLVANDTGGAVAQVFAAKHPERLATLTLTNCETHDNIPPPAFKTTVWLARLRLLAPLSRGIADNPAVARKRVFGNGYEHPELLPDDVVRSFIEPVAGTGHSRREFERFLRSVRARDLLAVESALRRLTVPTMMVWGTGDVFFDRKWAYWLRDTIPGAAEVVEVENGRLFFPDERAPELVAALRRHWAAHPATEQAPSRASHAVA